ncbi:MAG: SIS domain-containing protein [Acidobacteriota bacterium]|nr:SIS domain-containing protein [Acidobacteriota bacterium]
MNSDSATAYLRRLCDLACNVQVNREDGRPVPFEAAVAQAVDALAAVRMAGRKVLLVGNGGSAAVASHLQTDLCNAAGVRALVFNDAPLVTALANDFGASSVFERPASLWVDAGDLLLAVSSSGRSENILRAVRACVAGGAKAITLSGFAPDNPLRRSGHLNFYVSSQAYGYVELVHGILAHLFSDFLVQRQQREVPIEEQLWRTGTDGR